MKARFVFETVNFERGKDPKNSMGIGDRIFQAIDIIQKRIDERNPHIKSEFQWETFGSSDGIIEWAKLSYGGLGENIKIIPKFGEAIYNDHISLIRVWLLDEDPGDAGYRYMPWKGLSLKERLKIITDRI